MRNVTINLPESYCDGIERLIKDQFFPSRSESIRVALKEFIENEFEIIELFNLKNGVAEVSEAST
jgi:Arc/MetJ-type ribon-helix-helix transcriptional regulator